jgi:hypothetical protein
MLSKINVATFILLSILLYQQNCFSASEKLSEAEIDVKLAELNPLPKVHYFRPVDITDSNITPKRLYQLGRITHSLCLSAKWTNKEQVDKYVYICSEINKTKPSIKTRLGINVAAFYYHFGKDLPPTDRGPTYQEDIRQLTEQAKRVKLWIEEANKKYNSDVNVGAVTLDCERFEVKEGDEKWNEGIREALDTIHIRAKTIFTTARIEWFARRVQPVRVQGKAGWAQTPTFTGKEIKSSLSIYLYSVPDLEQMREAYRRTCELADELGVEDVTPWVALGSGYREGLIKQHYFDLKWSYDVIYSYQLGAELNTPWYSARPEKFASYDRAKVIIFWPPPLDERSPDWVRHFIAYVRGATGVKELKDLGYEGPRDETKKNL